MVGGVLASLAGPWFILPQAAKPGTHQLAPHIARLNGAGFQAPVG